MMIVSALKIIHIADVHFRGLTRHDEYRQVFESFFTKAQALQPDVIYIGGDIFHTKTQNISPEIIALLGWWFNELTKIAPVVVILGNHDGNLMNRDREDVITPIIDLLNNPRITLYKESGVYPVDGHPGFNWCVFSCFDEAGWKNVRPVNGEVNLALFHGGVWGSKTEADFELKGEVGVDFFNDYDFGLLGDIHKMQFLAWRDCIDGERRPWLAYCGSTIQQNYAEDPDHGFLYWQIKSANDFSVEFITLPNPSQFVTIDWNGSVDEVVAEAKKYPDGVRFRIRSKGTIPQADWRQMSKELRRSKSAKEVVPKVEAHEEIMTENSDVILELAHDLRQPKTHMQLMRDFYAEREDITKETWSGIEKCLVSYIGQCIADDDVARNTKWSLDKLEFTNTFAYGDDNYIDFKSMSGITGIFAPNASGKSSIIGSMMYTLFNATDRGPMKNMHVINIRKNDCVGRAHVTVNGQYQVIERRSRKQEVGKGQINAVTGLDYSAPDTAENLNGTQRRETEKKIRKAIGTPEDFMLTSLAVQGGLKSFISEGASQRKAILSRFLDMRVFEWIYDKAKADSLELKGKIKDMPERDWDGMRQRLDDEYGALQRRIEEIEAELDTSRTTLQEKQIQLAGFSNEKLVTKSDVEEQRATVQRLQDRVKDLTTRVKRLQTSLESAKHRVEIVENVKRGFALQAHEEREGRRTELNEWIYALEQQLHLQKQKLERKRKSVLKLAEVPCGDKFPTCKFIRDSHIDKEKIPEVEETIERMLNDVSSKKTVLDSLLQDGSTERLTRYRRIVGNESKYRLQVSRAEHDYDIAERDYATASDKLDRETDALLEIEQQFKKSDGTTYSREQRLLKEAIDDLKDVIKELDQERMLAVQKLGRMDALRSSLVNERKEYEELAQQWRVYELLMGATSKRGIPSRLLRQLVPVINDEIATILNGIAAFTIELELPDDSNAMDVYINYGDSRRIIELGSGMEKMIASIAIRVALINISSLPKTDMLWIDEGFSELDESNVEACGQLLRSLTQWFKNIIIITHISSLKDVVDSVIDIDHVGKDARVQHG